MSDSLRLVMAQLNLLVGDIAGNAQRIMAAAQRARDEFGAQLIVFPELALTGYPPEDLLLRAALHDRVLHWMERIQREVHGIHLIIGHPHLTADGLHNAATVLNDGRVLARYCKQHLPNYSVFDEKRYFVAGREACVVDIQGLPVGITICEDMWQPGPVMQAATAGAGLIVNLNASPFHVGKTGEREAVARERVRECGVPLVYVNMVGGQDELVFDGESFVMDGSGAVVQRARACVEGLYPVDIGIGNPAMVRPADCAPLPGRDESVYQVLVLGLRDYIRKNGFNGAVVGLSGGVDSALTLALAVDAIGAEQVEAVMMPSRFTAPMSIEDAQNEARALGVEYQVLPIEGVFKAFLDLLTDEFNGKPFDTTEENIQARCRGVILMAISNKKGKILLTTGNKSEMSVGYATLYGDMAGGFAPIKDVPKMLVYELARYRNTIAPVIPQRVLERAPSAELAPDQKDEDSLPPYAVLDPILDAYVEQDKSVEDIIAVGFAEDIVREVVRMVDRNEYKRRQAPPGVRITRRAFGRDRRYPITSGY